jgi:hypothetical protein
VPFAGPLILASFPSLSRVMRLGPEIGFVAARFSFATASPPAARCSGLIRFVPGQNGQWKIWVLSTILEEVSGLGKPGRA